MNRGSLPGLGKCAARLSPCLPSQPSRIGTGRLIRTERPAIYSSSSHHSSSTPGSRHALGSLHMASGICGVHPFTWQSIVTLFGVGRVSTCAERKFMQE